MTDASVVGLDVCAVQEVDQDRVADTRHRTISAGTARDIADVFALLGDPSRVRIVFTLLEAGELCVCDLAESVEMSDSAVSHALRLLRASGVVVNRRDGRMMRYRLADSHVRLLLDVVLEHHQHEQAEPSLRKREV